MDREKSGTLGWLGIGVGVAAFDLLSEETLTHAFKRGAENPRSRPFVLGGLGVTALHLLGALPKSVDPFYLALELPGVRRRNIDKGDTISD